MTFVPHEIDWTPEKSARLWDYYASSPAHWPQYFGAEAGGAVAAYLSRHARLRSGATIVDVSCGRGDLVAALRDSPLAGGGTGVRLVGLEFSGRSLEACRERCGGRWPEVEFRATDDALAEGTLRGDFLIATEVVEHLDDGELARFLADLRRLSTPGAGLLVTTPHRENYDASKVCCPECGCVFHRWQHRRVWTAETLRQTLEAAGWITQRCEPVDWGEFQPDTRPAWRRALSRWMQRFRTPAPRSGLAYLGTLADRPPAGQSVPA